MFLAVCASVASAVGAAFSTIITPLILLVCGMLLKLAIKLGFTGLAPLYAGINTIANAFFSSTPHPVRVLFNASGPLDALVLFVVLLVVPSLLAGALIWWGLRRLLLRAAGVDLIQKLNARPARADNLEERQLLNIVEEVAIGSGAPPPKLFIIDTATINAAALDRAPDDAALLVTSGLLERLDRDETEATIARLVTGLAAGDTHVASGIMAIFHTFYVFVAVLYLPLRLSSWIALGRIVRLIVTPRPETEAVANAVTSLEDATEPVTQQFMDRMKILAIPFLVPMAYQFVVSVWGFVALSYPMRGLWRNRCFWSDAQTVKLTRNPDAVVRALQKIGTAELPLGAESCDWLFISGPSQGSDMPRSSDGYQVDRPRAHDFELVSLRSPAIKARVDRLLAMGPGLPRASAGIWSSVAANPLRAPLLAVAYVLLAFLITIFISVLLFVTAAIMGAAGFVGFWLLFHGVNLLNYFMG